MMSRAKKPSKNSNAANHHMVGSSTRVAQLSAEDHQKRLKPRFADQFRVLGEFAEIGDDPPLLNYSQTQIATKIAATTTTLAISYFSHVIGSKETHFQHGILKYPTPIGTVQHEPRQDCETGIQTRGCQAPTA